MIGKFSQIEVVFSRMHDGAVVDFTAKTQAEYDEILNKYHYEYEEQGYRIQKYKTLLCSCGTEISCDQFTNTCSCGADYNYGGTLLAPRAQWGEETGEHWSDCL